VITSRTNSHTLALFLVSGFGSLILSACTEGTQPPTAANAVKPSFSVSTPVDDKVMGDLSVVAQDIIGALRNPGVRGALVRALKTSPYYGQIDLQDCGPMSLVGSMLQAAEGVGLGSANAMCALLSARRGVILYMDRDRLGGWDSTTVPVVTAIGDPEKNYTPAHVAYRSPTRTMTLPADGSFGGPLLVVLPYSYPGRRGERATQLTLRIHKHP